MVHSPQNSKDNNHSNNSNKRHNFLFQPMLLYHFCLLHGVILLKSTRLKIILLLVITTTLEGFKVPKRHFKVSKLVILLIIIHRNIEVACNRQIETPKCLNVVHVSLLKDNSRNWRAGNSNFHHINRYLPKHSQFHHFSEKDLLHCR